VAAAISDSAAAGRQGTLALVMGPPDGAPTIDKRKDKKMPSEKSQNVQDVFLNHVRKNKTPVTVFLINGVKLQGIITWFDNFCVLLRRDQHSQLVYKHAISTVMPASAIQLFEADKENDTGSAANDAGDGA
jgi:host factor-I protein